jgi:hypothetical protein
VRNEPLPGEAYFSGFDLMHPDTEGHEWIARTLHEEILRGTTTFAGSR